MFIYSTVDDTALACEELILGDDIQIDTDNFVPPFPDPWPGYPKSMAMLFEYGTDMRLWLGWDASGQYLIQPGSVDLSPSTAELTPMSKPANAAITILAVVWGRAQVLDQSVWDACYDLAATGGTFSWVNDFFNDQDSWYGVSKSGIIFYTDPEGNLQFFAGREWSSATWTAYGYAETAT